MTTNSTTLHYQVTVPILLLSSVIYHSNTIPTPNIIITWAYYLFHKCIFLTCPNMPDDSSFIAALLIGKTHMVYLCGYTSQVVVIRPQSVVIRLIVLPMRQHLTRKNPEVVMCPRPWLYVSCRSYTWLYTAYVSKRCHNLQTVVLSGYTIKAVVIRPSSWLYDLLHS